MIEHRVLNRRRHPGIDRRLLWDLYPLTLCLSRFSLFCFDTCGFAEEPPTLSVITSYLKIYWEPCEQKQNHRRIQSWIRLCLSNKPATYLLLFIWFTRELDYKVCTALTVMKINTKFLSMLTSWSGVCHLTWRQNWMIT